MLLVSIIFYIVAESKVFSFIFTAEGVKIKFLGCKNKERKKQKFLVASKFWKSFLKQSLQIPLVSLVDFLPFFSLIGMKDQSAIKGTDQWEKRRVGSGTIR